MALTIKEFSDADALTSAFADELKTILNTAIQARGKASLVVSGGRTPLALFQQLSQADLDWQHVDVTLADERWVDESDDASNTQLVKANLLTGKAAAARFVPLKNSAQDAADGVAEAEANIASMAQPFDALILGMGEDGHTASLFPCSEQVTDGLDMNSGRVCIAVTPTTAPHQRISLTLPALLNSRNIFLHLTGERKKQVLTDALKEADESKKPVSAVVNRAPVTLMWAP
ncbi:6-phosphogluconolactonase [Alteromonas sp. CYL-A6]|uniref:6-phosphogluconolactonase n=1 Tax=Alteromonas nitratireducens TaxID=3390813 RepID=UPI0034B5DD22